MNKDIDEGQTPTGAGLPKDGSSSSDSVVSVRKWMHEIAYRKRTPRVQSRNSLSDPQYTHETRKAWIPIAEAINELGVLGVVDSAGHALTPTYANCDEYHFHADVPNDPHYTYSISAQPGPWYTVAYTAVYNNELLCGRLYQGEEAWAALKIFLNTIEPYLIFDEQILAELRNQG